MSTEFDPKESFTSLNSILGSTEKMGEIIKKAIDKQADVKNAIKKEIIDMIRENKDCRKEIEKILKDVDRDWARQQLKSFGKTIGIGVWTLVVIVVTALVQHYTK